SRRSRTRSGRRGSALCRGTGRCSPTSARTRRRRTGRPRAARRRGGRSGRRGRRGSGRAAAASSSDFTLSPACGQNTVQDVVDGDRAEQVAVPVADGHADEVVGGHALGHLLLTKLGPDEVALLDALADAGGRRLTQQLLEPDGAEVAAGG